MGLGQNTRWNHLFQGLQEPSAAGILARHEVLVAAVRGHHRTLYAYEATGDPKYLEMHKQINEYTYARFPDKEYGEWYGYFHYDGTLSQPAKGNMYKGPFHIPRMLLKCNLLCKEILSGL